MANGPAIGIDLGTTNTVVACSRGDSIQIITDAAGNSLFPSVIAFPPNGGVLVGTSAKQRRIIDPQNTVYSAKRLIGQAYHSRAVQDLLSHLPYMVAEGENQECVVKTRAGQHRIAELSGAVLVHVRDAAEKFLGEAVSQCVITVPANFSDSQRQATRYAAKHAGLEVLRILNEPTAAALAYGAGQGLDQRIAVFDLGGGTFDLTILSVRGDMFEVVATGGDSFLGGDDMDRTLAIHLADAFLRKANVDLAQHNESAGRLLVEAERIKHMLSETESADLYLDELAYGLEGKPVGMRVRMTRGVFEGMIETIVERAIACTQGVLLASGVAAGAVDAVVLAGGATKVPLVRERVAACFGRPAQSSIDPMAVVAAGAALHAEALTTPPEQAADVGMLLDVTSHSLGIATAGGFVEAIIEQNTAIPVEHSRVFTTARDHQTEVRIRVCQGQERRFDDNIIVGELVLDQLRAAQRGSVRIEVAFLVNADGLLSVLARDLETGRHTRATLSLLGLSDEPSPPGLNLPVPESPPQ